MWCYTAFTALKQTTNRKQHMTTFQFYSTTIIDLIANDGARVIKTVYPWQLTNVPANEDDCEQLTIEYLDDNYEYDVSQAWAETISCVDHV